MCGVRAGGHYVEGFQFLFGGGVLGASFKGSKIFRWTLGCLRAPSRVPEGFQRLEAFTRVGFRLVDTVSTRRCCLRVLDTYYSHIVLCSRRLIIMGMTG